MSKKIKITIVIILILIITIIGLLVTNNKDNEELKTIKSEKELLRIYNDDYSTAKEVFTNIITMPFCFLVNGYYPRNYMYTDTVNSSSMQDTVGSISPKSSALDSVSSVEETSSNNSSKDYSTTNIQVENVDEADITKTDGDFIYSISDNNVVITNVIDPKDVKIEAKIDLIDNIPEDLILYKNQLVVISAKSENGKTYSYYRNNNTVVNIYDITTKSNPKLLKEYELHEPYYTSRCIDNNLYVIASGNLRIEDKENKKIDIKYTEDSLEKELEIKNIKRLKDVETTKQTLISTVDLDNAKEKVNIKSYLIDISNAYVSENSIYLLNQKYSYNNTPEIRKMFGLKGVIGLFEDYNEFNYLSTYNTQIYKFDILNDGIVKYRTKNKIKGRTINQYSLDEKNGHLRVALYDDEGARIAIFNEKLEQIGITDYVAKGEKMYSSRFMGDKAYLVTYKTIDPLFVIDLSDETAPKVLGKLKIPGYSTYLHPYDENHLIGIGMETEEVVNRDSSGKVTSTIAKIKGMKMALFDVTDVDNPIQISQTIIGDRRTTSAILTNPKALLFSKEKNLIAIPVNNYEEDFEISSSADTYSTLINSYTNYNKKYVAEGYFVYNINLEDGFKLKGVITHETPNKNKNQTYSYYYNKSKLLRGLYIDDNLYTVSETAVKVNNLDTLELISELKIEE